ncbi:hypothetical protein DFJ74DRAFT_751103 [Hyaloraphidium curvatum]|nr:hypothetical protein DFJ74DRAFT_751103 [Hyaloraphidium curvatum]
MQGERGSEVPAGSRDGFWDVGRAAAGRPVPPPGHRPPPPRCGRTRSVLIPRGCPRSGTATAGVLGPAVRFHRTALVGDAAGRRAWNLTAPDITSHRTPDTLRPPDPDNSTMGRHAAPSPPRTPSAELAAFQAQLMAVYAHRLDARSASPAPEPPRPDAGLLPALAPAASGSYSSSCSAASAACVHAAAGEGACFACLVGHRTRDPGPVAEEDAPSDIGSDASSGPTPRPGSPPFRRAASETFPPLPSAPLARLPPAAGGSLPLPLPRHGSQQASLPDLRAFWPRGASDSSLHEGKGVKAVSKR